jgi:hypothetical protein
VPRTSQLTNSKLANTRPVLYDLKVKNLFYSLNFRIFCLGLASGAVLLGSSAAIGYASFFGALFLNLAASALTIALTAISVDLIIKRTNLARTKAINQLASIACERIETLLLSGCASLYGYDFKNASTMTPELHAELDAFLGKRVKDPNAPIDLSRIKDFTVAIEEVNAQLDKMLQLYSFALNHEVLGTTVILRELTGKALDNIKTHEGDELKPMLRQAVRFFFEQYGQLKQFIEKSGGTDPTKV